MNEVNRPNIGIGSKSNVENIAGRDLNIKNIYNQYTPEFFSLSLDKYEESAYIIPRQASVLVELVMKEKFLVLAGDGYDKQGLTRYIAWRIFMESRDNEINTEVKQWKNTSNPQNFMAYLQNTQKPTAFIFLEISPHHVRYNLSGLYRVNQDNGHYLIITTDDTIEKWKVEKEIEPFFWQPSYPLYEEETLLRLLFTRFSDTLTEFPEELQGIELKPDSVFLDNLSLRDIALKLETPERIETFVKGLASLKSPVKESDISKFFEESQNDNSAIKRWFFGSLSPREKLITLGLCIFEGLYDDQYFAAMETVFQQSWRNRNPTLDALDYCDLDSLSNYYKLIELSKEDGIRRVESHLAGLRKILLELAWESHRRHILTALPVMEKLVKESVLPDVSCPELFGTQERKNRLREVISETFCTIGLISIDSIKDTMLRLAARKELDVQVVVARTMAQWRYDRDKDSKLFDILHSWQFNTTIREMLGRIVESNETDAKVKNKPLVYIKATIALTVGFAAKYDPPNLLNDRLIDLFEKLVDDTADSFIYSRFVRYTLPLVVRYHARQLRDILKDMVYCIRLNEPIGASLALAYQESPYDVQEILDSWYHSYRIQRSKSISPYGITYREAILATVAYAYGWIQYSEDKGVLAFDDGFKCLQNLLESEINLHVRKAAVSAVIYQINFNFEKTEKHLNFLFSCMYKYEIKRIVDELVEKHLEQREEFDNGYDYFEWKGRIYSVWLNSEQPLTNVEKVIRKWIKDGDNYKTQQVALKFLTSKKLIEFQQEEERIVKTLKIEIIDGQEPGKSSEQPHPAPSFDSDADYSKLTVWFVSWLVTLRDKEYMDVIKGILPEALRQNFSHRHFMGFVLEKLDKDSDKQIRNIVEKLKWALLIARRAKIFVAGFIFLIVIILYLILN